LESFKNASNEMTFDGCDDDDEFDVSVRSVAVARTSFAACARDRVSIFSRALDA